MTSKHAPATSLALDDPQGQELAIIKEHQRKIDAYPRLVEAVRALTYQDRNRVALYKSSADLLRELGEL